MNGLDGNYRYSRANAQRWGTRVEGCLTCRGACPYKRFHEELCLLRGKQPIGGKCVLEFAFGRQLAVSLCEQHPLLVERRPDEFRPLVEEIVYAALIRERLHGRMNVAWELGPDFHELDLCFRYATATNNRHKVAMERIYMLEEEVRAELEDAYWRTKALSSAIGSKNIPEPYRTWAKDMMAEYRRLQSAPQGSPAKS